jgi:hypothetical protein
MVGTEVVLDILVHLLFNHPMLLLARKSSVEFGHCASFVLNSDVLAQNSVFNE